MAEKSLHVLITALDLLRHSISARVIIVGEGPLRSSLEAQVSELDLTNHVKLPGFRRNPFPFLDKAGLFVLSSSNEGFPNVLVEALSCGVPIVSTDCENGPAEILENGRWGKLVPVGNPELLAEGILAALRQRHNTEAMITRANEFTSERTVNKYLDLLFSLPTDRIGNSAPDLCPDYALLTLKT
jgi:glycosyltransferase involved in cell wall biosynthesis